MRRLFRLKNRKILAGPYLFWAMSFIIIPLLMILYYGLTDKNGSFTLNNLSQMTTPENLKALGLALLLSFISTLICLVLAYPLAMILAEKNMNQTSFIVLKCKPVQLRSTCFHPSDVDEFSSSDISVADTFGKKRSH